MMTDIKFKGPRTPKRNGFSLIELLIVVAIILIIAAIAIPNFIHARMAANESTAVSSIHAINTSEIAYSSANPTIGYSAALADLGPSGAGYLDAVLSSGTKSGYTLTYVQDPSSTPSVAYTLNADPVTRGTTGQRSFFSSQVNVTHYNMSAVSTATDPIIQ
jgi:type IV pilus assembly protein PilA